MTDLKLFLNPIFIPIDVDYSLLLDFDSGVPDIIHILSITILQYNGIINMLEVIARNSSGQYFLESVPIQFLK